MLAVCSLVGCDRPAGRDGGRPGSVTLSVTPTAVRADRRLYDGAPPVIPHPPLNIACIQCHTDTGREAPPLGFAPANPHAATAGLSGTSDCRQCHVFRREDSSFQGLGSDFARVSEGLRRGDRLYPGAPPTIPHRVFMRENCTSCHSGPAARPEILCRHIERVNCRQCHVPKTTVRDEAAAENLARLVIGSSETSHRPSQSLPPKERLKK